MSMSRLSVLAVLPFLISGAAFAQSAGGGGNMRSGMPEQGQMMLEQGPGYSPASHKRMCTGRYAHEASRLAYLEAELNLTDAQRPAWTKWRQIVLDGSAKQRDQCLETKVNDGATIPAPEREAFEEKMLTLRLDTLKASSQALTALYGVLTPEQKTLFDQPRNHHRGMHSGQDWKNQ